MTPDVKALFFDVFGTLTDFRTSIAREAEAMLKPLGYALDWPAFADAWRGEYQGALEEVRSGRMAYCKLDVLHRRNLEITLKRFKTGPLNEEQLRELNLAWHRLDAWPDVPPGLVRLKRKYLLSPLSNGNISLMIDIARRNNFPWDAILGADIARRLQAEAARLSCRRGGARSCTARLHAGGRPLQRSESRCLAGARHRAYRAPERTRCRKRRGRAGRAGRCRG